MANQEKEKLVIRKQIPMIRATAIPLEDKYSFQVLTKGQINEDPFSLPPIRDIFMPPDNRGLEYDFETVKHDPFDGEVFVLGQRNEQNKIVIDNLDPKKGSFWLNFSGLNEANSASKRFYLDQGKSGMVNNTEEIVFSTIDNFPQFFDGDLGDNAVKKIINNICSNLVIEGQIIDGDNQKYIDYALHKYRGINKGGYSEQGKKSHIGTVILNVIDDLIEERGIMKQYSPTLAILLVEQQIEQRFLKDLQKDFIKSVAEQLQPHFFNLEQLEKSLLKSLKKYFGFPIFRCFPIKQSAEEIKRTMSKINRVIKEFGNWNPNEAVNIVNELMIRTK